MFLHEIRETGAPDLNQLDLSSINWHLVYRNKLKQDLQRRFRLDYLGQLKQNYQPVKKALPEIALKQFAFQILKQLYLLIDLRQWMLPLFVFLMRTGIQSVMGVSSMNRLIPFLMASPSVPLDDLRPAFPLTIPDDPVPAFPSTIPDDQS
ncbi:hypothetical protein TNCT_556321 [Trichonephila clavata]|uniref:Uncharacterized protein n=1 Tax=Trichonephila clavata TaxID=2740835 RepID=A0A8X6LG07_TRICU|nr:hypothetical protein TNCT_556321 [Trichonephila clavata]